MTASKVASVLGLSPWESRFSTWHKMAGYAPPQAENNEMRRGHYLEPAICQWFGDQHPELYLSETGMWVSTSDPIAAATPDRLIYPAGGRHVIGALEVKTASSDEGWGPTGSDEIPVYYRTQVMWQMYVLGLPSVHVAVLTSYLEFSEYLVARDDSEIAFIRAKVAEFMASLANDERPDIDAHSSTLTVIREMHPDINGEDVEIDPDLAEQYRRARAEAIAAKAQETAMTATVLDAIGDGKRAVVGADRIAMRVIGRGSNPPYLKACPPPKPPKPMEQTA